MAGDMVQGERVRSEIVTHPVRSIVLASWHNMPTTEDQPPVCTWSLETVEGRARLHRVIQAESLALWDMCERGPFDFTIDHVAAHYSTYEPEDRPGEVVQGAMLSLIGGDMVYHTSSQWVYRSLQQLAMIEGPPPWTPPIILRAERLPTRNRHVRLSVAFMGRDPLGKLEN